MLAWLKSTNAKVYGEERPRMAGFSVMLLPKNILESVAIIISASMKHYRAVVGLFVLYITLIPKPMPPGPPYVPTAGPTLAT